MSMYTGFQTRLSLQMKQVFSIQQVRLASVLTLDAHELEEYVAEMVAKNPALSRVRPDQAGGAVAKRFLRPPDEALTPMEARTSIGPDLEEELLDQVRLERTTEAERAAAEVIIFNLDEKGLLALSLEEVARDAGVDVASARSAQALVMQMDPQGCGADDLYHYLTWQVTQRWPEDPYFPDLVRDHLGDLRQKKFARIGELMEMEAEDVEEYFEMLQGVPPFPTYGKIDGDTVFVEPAFAVERDENGRWAVVMKEAPKAQLGLSDDFQSGLEALEGEQKKDAKMMLEHAREVIKHLDERRSLLERIARRAVEFQNRWFDDGDAWLRNLKMQDVAEELRCDASQVSRVVGGTWFEWNGQVKRLRDLFTTRPVRGGMDLSEPQLHALLREVIEKEDPRDPLSDAAIEKLLARRGVVCKRRTVAKHRNRIGIPGSADRKKE